MISLLRTRGALSDRGKAFLAPLPLCVKDGAVCYVHASADTPAEWPYVDGHKAARKIRAAGLPESLVWRLETGR